MTVLGKFVSDLKDPRVLFAAERTLLAWNRTGLSLIALGFIVERAGLLMQDVAPAGPLGAQVALTFWLGICFIALGAFSSAYSAKQYAAVLRTLSPHEFPPGYAARWALVFNVVVAALGVLLMVVLVVARIP